MGTYRKDKDCAALSSKVIAEATRMLKLLAHPQRLRIIEILENKSKGLPVHDLTHLLGIPQATVSQHLGIMQRMGFLQGSREKQEVWYKIVDERPLRILNCIRKGANRS